MPRSPERPCDYPTCSSTARPGKHYCAKHGGLEYDKRRGTAAQRGYGAEWARLSSDYRALIGNQCEIVVGGQRCAGKCEAVHHIEPVATAPHRRLDRTNLVGLCRSHHAYAEQNVARTGVSPPWCHSRVMQ